MSDVDAHLEAQLQNSLVFLSSFDETACAVSNQNLIWKACFQMHQMQLDIRDAITSNLESVRLLAKSEHLDRAGPTEINLRIVIPCVILQS